MSHVSHLGGKPLHERTNREIVWMFCIVPIVIGVGAILFVGAAVVHYRSNFVWQDWLGVVWASIVAPVLAIGLPATGWKELRRRRQAKFSADATPQENKPA